MPLALSGVGWSMIIMNLWVCIYYGMILAWSVFYLFASFTSSLPWATCNNDFNSICKYHDSFAWITDFNFYLISTFKLHKTRIYECHDVLVFSP